MPSPAAEVRVNLSDTGIAGIDLIRAGDPAFAYTDPDRVQSLQRMLDLAALRSLQIIILTGTMLVSRD